MKLVARHDLNQALELLDRAAIEHRLLTESPFPIAYPFSRYLEEKDIAQRQERFFKEVLSALLRYVALLAISEYLLGKHQSSGPINALLQELSLRRAPSEGAWRNYIDLVLRHLDGEFSINGLKEFRGPALADKSWRAKLETAGLGLDELEYTNPLSLLVVLRNKVHGHEAVWELQDKQALAPIMHDLFLVVVEALPALFEYELLVREAPGIANAVVMSGLADFAHSELPIDVSDAWLRDKASSHRIFPVFPLLVGPLSADAVDPSGRNVFLFEQFKSRLVIYRGVRPKENHRVAPKLLDDKQFDGLNSLLNARGVYLDRADSPLTSIESMISAAERQLVDYLEGEKSSNRYPGAEMYVRRRAAEPILEEFIDSDQAGLLVTGGTGTGKSSLLCHFAEERGIGKKSADLVMMFRADRIAWRNPETIDELEQGILGLWGQAESLAAPLDLLNAANLHSPDKPRRLILIIDQVDHFLGIGRTPDGVLGMLDHLLTSYRAKYPCLKVIASLRRESYLNIRRDLVEGRILDRKNWYASESSLADRVYPQALVLIPYLPDEQNAYLRKVAEKEKRAQEKEGGSTGQKDAGVGLNAGNLSWRARRQLRSPVDLRIYTELVNKSHGDNVSFKNLYRDYTRYMTGDSPERLRLISIVLDLTTRNGQAPTIENIREHVSQEEFDLFLDNEVDSPYEILKTSGLLNEYKTPTESGSIEQRVSIGRDKVLGYLTKEGDKFVKKHETMSLSRTIIIFSLLGISLILGSAFAIDHYIFKPAMVEKLRNIDQVIGQLGLPATHDSVISVRHYYGAGPYNAMIESGIRVLGSLIAALALAMIVGVALPKWLVEPIKRIEILFADQSVILAKHMRLTANAEWYVKFHNKITAWLYGLVAACMGGFTIWLLSDPDRKLSLESVLLGAAFVGVPILSWYGWIHEERFSNWALKSYGSRGYLNSVGSSQAAISNWLVIARMGLRLLLGLSVAVLAFKVIPYFQDFSGAPLIRQSAEIRKFADRLNRGEVPLPVEADEKARKYLTDVAGVADRLDALEKKLGADPLKEISLDMTVLLYGAWTSFMIIVVIHMEPTIRIRRRAREYLRNKTKHDSNS